MAFGLFSGTSPAYKGTGSIQPQQHAGVTGFLTTLFGGAATPAYKRPLPPATAPTEGPGSDGDETVVATDKTLTVIVVLDTEALGQALLPHLQAAADSITND